MRFFEYFFRANEDGFVLKLYGPVHLTMVTIFILGCILIAKKFNGHEKSSKNQTFMKTLALILLVDQIILYSWQVGSGYFRLDMSLPLYHCRLAAWALIIGVLFDISSIKTIGLFWGTMGSLISMVMPELYAFSFPHYTNIQYFIVHLSMGWMALYMLIVEKMPVSKKQCSTVLLATNFFNVFLVAVNLGLRLVYPKVNYGYMLDFPGSLAGLLSPVAHIIFMFAAFNLGVLILYSLFRLAQKSGDKERYA